MSAVIIVAYFTRLDLNQQSSLSCRNLETLETNNTMPAIEYSVRFCWLWYYYFCIKWGGGWVGVDVLCNSGDLLTGSLTSTCYIDAAPLTVTTSSLSARSVFLSFSQHEFSLPIVQHSVTLTRVTGSSQMLCPTTTHKIPVVIIRNNTLFVTDLEEYSRYSVTIDTTFTGPLSSEHMLRTVSEIFTSSAGIQHNF